MRASSRRYRVERKRVGATGRSSVNGAPSLTMPGTPAPASRIERTSAALNRRKATRAFERRDLRVVAPRSLQPNDQREFTAELRGARGGGVTHERFRRGAKGDKGPFRTGFRADRPCRPGRGPP